MSEEALRQVRFEDMAEPPFADRVRAFELWLESEPCANDGGCIVLSNSGRMCPPCRLSLHFFHCAYNAEAYEGGPGEIPRLSTESALQRTTPGCRCGVDSTKLPHDPCCPAVLRPPTPEGGVDA